MDKSKKRREAILAIGLAAIIAGIYFVGQIWPVRDFFSGISYHPDNKTQEIQDSLELTDVGKRILAATQPTLEASTAFNYHCDSHKSDVSLLGCYADGKIYVYEITKSEIADSNKVTLAHELLHAVWERTNDSEKARITKLLKEVKETNREFFATELASYTEDEQLEEVYTRAGTKLRNLPNELEEHYARYFKNRTKIVDYYESYQAPFRKLQDENKELEIVIMATKSEIAKEREAYLAAEAELEVRIETFNSCANQAGCFHTREDFERERSEIIKAQEALELTRKELNDKIDKNNARVELFRENQLALGELSNAMNSNMEEVKE